MADRKSEKDVTVVTADSDADAQLSSMGYKTELARNFTPLSMLGLAFAILNTWTALAASLSLALPSGGSVSVIWGFVTAGICNLCLAISLAEFLSAFPTAGGQYHWVAMVAWKEWARILSWTTGWITVFAWMAVAALGGLFGSQLIVGIIVFMEPEYVFQRWHQFLIYVAFTLIAFFFNAFATRLLPLVSKAAFIWSIGGFVIITITLLACAAPGYQSGKFAYGTFINETGWPDGIAWLLGLLQGSLSLTAYDAVAHMIEEIPNPSITGPKIMIGCVLLGIVTGFIFLSVLLFVLHDVDAVISAPAGPILQIFLDATNSRAGSVCLMIFPLACLLLGTIVLLTSSSRQTYAFARDRGLPLSRVLSTIHPTLHVPLPALLLSTSCVLALGLLVLASSAAAAFGAIVSAAVVALGVSYALPTGIFMLRGRDRAVLGGGEGGDDGDDREGRRGSGKGGFRMKGWVGWVVNAVAVGYTVLTTVLFLFPAGVPVREAQSMNYCVVVFVVVVLISLVQWVVDGRKHFVGPGRGGCGGH